MRAGLAEWQRGLSDPALRVVPAENLHITLVFLGWQAEKDFERIADAALGRDAPPPRAPEVELLPEPVGRPPGRRPRLFAIEARAPGVEELQAQVEGRLERGALLQAREAPLLDAPDRGAGEAGEEGRPKARAGGEAAGSAARTDVRVFPSDTSGGLQIPLAPQRCPLRTDG